MIMNTYCLLSYNRYTIIHCRISLNNVIIILNNHILHFSVTEQLLLTNYRHKFLSFKTVKYITCIVICKIVLIK